jgi:cyclopropane-fatty-acyl-phospholipid synthase
MHEAAEANLQSVESHAFGASYARTLLEWRERFLRAWPSIERLGYDLQFRRMWEFYLAYCEVGFRHRAVDVTLFKLAG